MARNARFTLNPASVQLVATGKVSAAVDWTVDVAPGTPRAQRRDDYNTPIWLVDCIDESDPEAGRASVVGVEIASPVAPNIEKYRPLELSTAQVSLYVDKRNHLAVGYTATLKSAAKSASGSQSAAA